MDKIADLKEIVISTLDLNKAQDIVTIDLKDKSSMADYMIIASGTSSRHIQSLSEQVLEKLKNNGVKDSKIEGKESSEWKLVDGIDLIDQISDVYTIQNIRKTEILAASVRDVKTVSDSFESGAHVVTMPPAVFEKMYNHVLTDKGLYLFDMDWAKVKR